MTLLQNIRNRLLGHTASSDSTQLVKHPICIVCPHTSIEHFERGDYYAQTWCKPCNEDEIAGPCSYYFIGRHSFIVDTHHITDCKICKLGVDSDAHKEPYVK